MKIKGIILILLILLSFFLAVKTAESSEMKLTAEIIGWDAVNLTWTQVENVKGYEIYRSTNLSDLLSSNNLLVFVNWGSIPEYKQGWTSNNK